MKSSQINFVSSLRLPENETNQYNFFCENDQKIEFKLGIFKRCFLEER